MNSNGLILVVLVASMFIFSACSEREGTSNEFVPPGQTPSETPTPPRVISSSNQSDLEAACVGAEGHWVADTKECEWISEELCDDLGGTYNECGSACRNDPDSEFCIMMCVQYCSFE